jgi:hypothetical protein
MREEWSEYGLQISASIVCSKISSVKPYKEHIKLLIAQFNCLKWLSAASLAPTVCEIVNNEIKIARNK